MSSKCMCQQHLNAILTERSLRLGSGRERIAIDRAKLDRKADQAFRRKMMEDIKRPADEIQLWGISTSPLQGTSF